MTNTRSHWASQRAGAAARAEAQHGSAGAGAGGQHRVREVRERRAGPPGTQHPAVQDRDPTHMTAPAAPRAAPASCLPACLPSRGLAGAAPLRGPARLNARSESPPPSGAVLAAPGRWVDINGLRSPRRGKNATGTELPGRDLKAPEPSRLSSLPSRDPHSPLSC